MRCAPPGSSVPTASSTAGGRRRGRRWGRLGRRHLGYFGSPEGCRAHPRRRCRFGAATTARLGVDPARHVWLACLPLAHVGGLSVVTRALLDRDSPRGPPGFEAEAVEDAGRSGRVSTSPWWRPPCGALDPSVFTCVLLGGSRPPTSCPPTRVATYGMTETGSGVIYDGWPSTREVSFESGHRAARWYERRRDPRARCHVAALLSRRRRRAGPRTRRRRGLVRHRRRRSLDADGRLVVSGRIADVITTGARRSGPTRSSASSAHPAWPRSRYGSDPIPNGASGSWPGWCPPAARPSTNSARWWRKHRALGRSEGAGAGRRPPPDRGGQDPAAGARDLRLVGRPGPEPVKRRPRGVRSAPEGTGDGKNRVETVPRSSCMGLESERYDRDHGFSAAKRLSWPVVARRKRAHPHQPVSEHTDAGISPG